MKNPIPTHPPRRTPSRLPRQASQAAMVLGSLALSALGGCGSPEPSDELIPVRADEILDNDAPLGRLHEIKKGAILDTLLPFEGTAGVILPSSFDVLSLEGPVRNQSHRGVCSIFSTIGLMEMLYKKAGMANPDFSEQYLQWAVKVQDHAFPDSEGSSDNYNLETINKFGIPAESAWPYDNYPWSTANDPACTGAEEGLPTKCYTNGEPSAAARSATKYKLPAGRSVSTSSIKNVIFEKKVGVVVGLDFFYQAWNHRLSTLPVNAVYFGKGYVLNPNAADIRESRKQPAGHSVQLVGWDDNLQIQQVDAAGKPVVDAMGKPVKEQGFYLFKNSWGTASFGVNNSKAAGYGWISYKYIASYGTANTSDPPTLRP
jgi:C1A family cysteine protease